MKTKKMATTKSNDIRNAEADNRVKMRLERRLSMKMVSQFNAIASDTKKHYITTKNVLLALLFLPEMQYLIENHYLTVAKVFAKRVNKDDVKLTIDEAKILRNKIMQDAKRNADVSSKEILDTVQRDINASFAEARTEALKKQEVLSTRKLASIMSAKFKRKSIARAKTTIPLTQTQQAAEKTKYNVFNAHHNAINKPNKKTGIKTWHTIGDDRVREAHREANLQSQQLNLPFEVGGEQLMQPGDTSLGATPGNTINCRCSAQYSFR